jgi:sigma-B regulation protein RsbU (phosphoserine phosphatase)
MKIRGKYLLFFSIALFSSLSVFIIVALEAYSRDKIGFVKDKATQEVLALSRQTSEYIRVQGPSALLAPQMADLFSREDMADKFLVDKQGVIQVGETALVGKSFADTISLNALSRINMTPFASGLIEAKDNQDNDILVAYASVPEAQALALQVYKTSQVNRFLILFIVKILFAFMAIGCFFLFLGFIVVGQLSRGLESLSQSAEVFGAGDFGHRVKVKGKDEVASLGIEFNRMAKRIEESLKLEEEKARLKMEMETAQKVQETLFLPNSYKNDDVEIAGFYEPASECGGDWWYYFEKGDSTWVCIGDVTGHGVGAAMLTSSVRAAFSFFQAQENLRPSDVLNQLNRVIWESVGGKFNMTFFILEVDRLRKKIRYANSSHEFPLLLARGKPMKKKDLMSLMDVNGPRLGESGDYVYKEYEMDLPPGSRLICYSDGLYDVQDKTAQAFGDVRLMRQILKINALPGDSQAFVKNLMSEILQHRDGSPLVDDVSLLCVDLDIANSMNEEVA